MPEQPAAERTEPATPKRREDARKKGDVAQSRDVSSVVVLGAAFGAAAWALHGDAVGRLGGEIQQLWGGGFRPQATSDYHALLLRQGRACVALLMPVVALIATAGLLAPLVQVGPLFSFEALQPKWERVDPLAGMKRLVSVEKLFDLAKALLKFAVVAGTLWVILRAALPGLLVLSAASVGTALDAASTLLARGAAWTLAALGILAVFDLMWVRFRYDKKLKMTRQQVREEIRDRDGQPEQRGRMRTLQRELSRSRMIQDVATADLVVRNPTHFAVALCYQRGEMGAPRVVAKGRDRVALRILDAAAEHDVPVVENPPLARSLYRSARLGQEIPEALYQAVAEAMAYVFRLDRRRAGAWGAAS